MLADVTLPASNVSTVQIFAAAVILAVLVIAAMLRRRRR